MGKAPSAPDPVNTINQQTSANKETAIAQAGLNYVNQQGPNGSLTYQQIGTWPDGTPRYQSTTALSSAGQQLQSTNEGTAQNLANVAKDQSGRLGSLLNAPIDFIQQKDYLEGLTSGALDKRWDMLGQQNETDLVNRGIRPGSTQYDALKNSFRVDQSDAYNSANMSNYNTALQSQLALRAQPLNEILALSGQSQVQQPQFGSVNSPQIAGTDTAGITNAGYQQQMQGYNANQGVLGGLFSAGASLIPMFSDARLKTNLVKVGAHPIGVDIYDYDWIDTGIRERGVLAQDLQKVRPDLVDDTHESGFLRVRYYELGMR